MDDDKQVDTNGQTIPRVSFNEVPGQLVALKSPVELKSGDTVIDVYVTKVSTRAANSVLSQLRLISESSDIDLQHLRRLATFDHLPERLRSQISQLEDARSDAEYLKGLFLIISPTHAVELQSLREVLYAANSCIENYSPIILTISVPMLAPTSQQQADSWSLSHWPTTYKKNNPFGPHPSVVSRATSDITIEVSMWMAMARRAAVSSEIEDIGEAIGAVIVERSNGIGYAVALAGDGRWNNENLDRIGPGNVMGHAVLRAIALVARKLRTTGRVSPHPYTYDSYHCEDEAFLDVPLTDEEREVFASRQLSSDGYLCHGLEIYLTHEPCVMCSMALLHSRFGKVVFGRRIPGTGGLCSEVAPLEIPTGLGHGLFRRRELNWSLMAWQYSVPENSTDVEELTPNFHT